MKTAAVSTCDGYEFYSKSTGRLNTESKSTRTSLVHLLIHLRTHDFQFLFVDQCSTLSSNRKRPVWVLVFHDFFRSLCQSEPYIFWEDLMISVHSCSWLIIHNGKHLRPVHLEFNLEVLFDLIPMFQMYVSNVCIIPFKWHKGLNPFFAFSV